MEQSTDQGTQPQFTFRNAETIKFSSSPQSPQPVAEDNTGDVMRTLRTSNEGVGNNPGQTKQIVTVKGTEMDVETAHRMGFVGRNQDGQYYDLTTSEQQSPAEGSGEAQASDEEAAGPQGLFNEEFTNRIGGMAYEIKSVSGNVPQVLSEYLENPEEVPASIVSLVKEGRHSAQDITEGLGQVHAQVENALGSIWEGIGIDDLNAAYEFISQKQGQKNMVGAFSNLLLTQDPRQFIDWGREYVYKVQAPAQKAAKLRESRGLQA